MTSNNSGFGNTGGFDSGNNGYSNDYQMGFGNSSGSGSNNFNSSGYDQKSKEKKGKVSIHLPTGY